MCLKLDNVMRQQRASWAVLGKQLTPSVDDQIIGFTTDRDGGDIADVLVGDRARADCDGAGGSGMVSVDRADAGVALLNNVVDRCDVGVFLQGQDDRLGPALKRRRGHSHGSNGKDCDEQHSDR